MFGELPFQSLKVLLLSFSPFSLNNTCKLELSLVCSRGVRGVACCSLGHFQHLWYNLAKTITTLHLIFVVTCAVQCNAVYKMQLKLKCFNYQNLTLFTLDQEYEVKSLCETPGTKQKRFTKIQKNKGGFFYFLHGICVSCLCC